MCQRRYSKRVRRFSALLAFVVGISIGFLLTARARLSVVSSAGVVVSSGAVVGCRAGGDRRLQAAIEGHFAAFLQAARLNASLPAAVPGPVPVGPSEAVTRLLQSGGGLLFVGVMTAQKYVDTRAVAVHRTWARHLPAGHVVFFVRADARAPPELPVVRLAGVDDAYPPQKKSFLMLKYMHDHFLDKYEWFMRADDDVYVRGHLLERFLRSVNGSRPQFIGQAGMGNKEEFGQLNLDHNENFCMGGPGIVFSRQTLKLVAPHVKHCLQNLYSTHEDVEVGRCVRQFAAIPCTWSYEVIFIIRLAWLSALYKTYVALHSPLHAGISRPVMCQFSFHGFSLPRFIHLKMPREMKRKNKSSWLPGCLLQKVDYQSIDE